MEEVPGKPYSAFCKTCKIELKPHKNDLRKYTATSKHRSNLQDIDSLATLLPVNEVFRLAVPDLRKVAEIKMAIFVAIHAAFWSADHLMSLIPAIFPDSKIASGIKMHRTKCTGLIKNLIKPCLLKELLTDVSDSYFSLIIDEATDVSKDKILAVCIRFFSKSKSRIATSFLSWVVCSAGTSDAIGQAIVMMLQTYKLDL